MLGCCEECTGWRRRDGPHAAIRSVLYISNVNVYPYPDRTIVFGSCFGTLSTVSLSRLISIDTKLFRSEPFCGSNSNRICGMTCSETEGTWKWTADSGMECPESVLKTCDYTVTISPTKARNRTFIANASIVLLSRKKGWYFFLYWDEETHELDLRLNRLFL